VKDITPHEFFSSRGLGHDQGFSGLSIHGVTIDPGLRAVLIMFRLDHMKEVKPFEGRAIAKPTRVVPHESTPGGCLGGQQCGDLQIREEGRGVSFTGCCSLVYDLWCKKRRRVIPLGRFSAK
jgi:hypothetical protein